MAKMSKLNNETKVAKSTIDVYVDCKPINERLLHLSMRTGYPCIQRNGQRYYGPPPNWEGKPPEKGSEIFIGRLPRDCFEDELVPIFESIAPIYELRMMMNFTGYNRGFAFITYCNSSDAWRAIQMLNNFEIRPGHKLGISKSVDNCRLYVGGIPMNKNRKEVWEELMKICSTVKEIIMYPNPEDRKKNRGFLFVEFEDHRTAAMAKRMLAPGTTKLFNQEVIVDWADPEPDVDPAIMAMITKLFLRNITPSFTIDVVRRILQEVVPVSAVQRIYVAGHYGFVHFDNRVHAQLAKDRLSLICLEGELLEVHWARPKCYRKHSSSHCRSLPPRFRRDRSAPQQEPTQQQVQEYMVPTVVPMPVPVPPLPVPNITPLPVQNQVAVQPLVQIPGPVEINNNSFKGSNPLPTVHPYATVQYPYYPTTQIMYPQNPVQFYTQ